MEVSLVPDRSCGDLEYALAATLGRYAIGIFIGMIVAGLALEFRARPVTLHSSAVWTHVPHTGSKYPLFAWVPLIMAWFGLNESSKIVFIALSAFFPVLLGTLEGVASVPREFVELVSTYEYTRRQLLCLSGAAIRVARHFRRCPSST